MVVSLRHGPVPFKLFEYQKRLIQFYLDSEKGIAIMPRQSGKTTCAAAFILWWAIFKKKQDILILSKDQAGAKEVMDRIWYMYEELQWFLKPGASGTNVHTKKFDNGSKIRALATTTSSGRGTSMNLIYLDEFAYVLPSITDKLWTSVYPSISTGGRCLITSTPNTDEDKFFKIWSSSTPHQLSDDWQDHFANRNKSTEEEVYETFYETVDIKTQIEEEYDSTLSMNTDETTESFVGFYAPWTKVPYHKSTSGFRDEGFKKEMLMSGLSMDEWYRDFECSFITADATLISPQKLVTMARHIRKPRFIDRWGCRWYEDILPNTAYAVVLDPSEGVDRDDACIQVWEIPELKQVAEWHTNKADQPEQAKMLMRVLRRIYNMQSEDPDHFGEVNIYYSVEKNGLGIGVLSAIQYEGESNFPGWLIDSSNNPKGRGLSTTLSTKRQHALEFKSLVERDLFIPRSKYLLSQMKSFIKSGQSYKAKSGRKDDIVMSCILMCHLIEEIRYHEPDLDDRVRVEVEDYNPDDEKHPANQVMGIFF
jgi:hypothetical protein